MTLQLDRTTWTRVRFDEIALNVTDRVDDPSAAGVDRYVGLEHLDPGSMTVNRWGSPEEVAAQKLRFQPGDVIFGRRRAYQKKVAQADFEGICSAHALVLRARTGVVSPEFLAVFLSSDYFLDRAISISVGSLSPTVNWRDLARQEFDLPPLDEQHRIASLLWAAERSRQDSSQMLEMGHRLRRAWLDEAICRLSLRIPTTLGELARVGTIKFLTGPFGSSLSAREYVTGGVPVIHPVNIVNGVVAADLRTSVNEEAAARLQRWRVQIGDIVLTRKRDVNRSALIGHAEAGWVLGSDCISLRVVDQGQYLPRFVRLMLQSSTARRELLRRAPGTAMPGINEKSLAPLVIPTLSLNDQRDFLEGYDRFDLPVQRSQHGLDLLDELKSSLVACFAGEEE